MSEQAATALVKFLSNELKGAWSQEAMKKVWPELCDQPDKALMNAGDYLCLNSNGFLPSPQKLLDTVKAEAKKLNVVEARQREDEWNRTKGGASRQDLQKAGSIFTAKQSTEMAQRSAQLIVGLLAGKVSRSDYLEAHKHLDTLYPGVGFGLAGAKLQKEWQ